MQKTTLLCAKESPYFCLCNLVSAFLFLCDFLTCKSVESLVDAFVVLGLLKFNASFPASVNVNVCPVSIPDASSHDIVSCADEKEVRIIQR